jgi:hypothetical protein
MGLATCCIQQVASFSMVETAFYNYYLLALIALLSKIFTKSGNSNIIAMFMGMKKKSI